MITIYPKIKPKMCHVAVEWMNDRELHRTDRESLDEDSSGLRIEILDLDFEIV